MIGDQERHGERIEAVGLDLMGTLLVDPFREAITAATGISYDRLGELRQLGSWPAFELGQIEEEGYGEAFFKPGTGLRLDVARLWRELDARYAFLPGMENLLAELASHRRVLILSNYTIWYERLRRRFLLDRYVSGHFPSYVVGARKPDAAYYRRVLAMTGLAPESLLLVDDREENVSGARSVGLPALVFHDAATLRKQISGLI